MPKGVLRSEVVLPGSTSANGSVSRITFTRAGVTPAATARPMPSSRIGSCRITNCLQKMGSCGEPGSPGKQTSAGA